MKNHPQQGFTLIELITVITIMAMLSTIGIASFLTYSRTQALSSSTQDVVTMLQLAKASTASQVKPVSCDPGVLDGYQVTITVASGTYSIAPVCGGSEDVAAKKTATLPDNISFDATSSQTVLFHTISGDVTETPVVNPPKATIILKHSQVANYTKTITVEKDGRIHVQ